MKRMIAWILAIVLCVPAFLMMGGCSKSSDEITVWWPSGSAMEEIINSAITDYTSAHTDVKIKVVYKPMDAFDAYKYALNDNKTRPDIAILDHVYVQALAYNGLLMNMSDYGSDDMKKLYPSALYQANMYNGHAYALPLSANTVVLMYNKDILKTCGITDEQGNAKAPSTMDELLADCAIIKNKGYTAFAQPLNDFSAMEFVSYVARRGGKLVSDDYKTVTLNSDPVKAAVGDWKKLSAFSNTASYEEDKFYTGSVAFVEMGSWALNKVTGSAQKFDCGFAEMVKIDKNTENYSGLGLYSLCIANQSNKKKQAFGFAQYLSTNKKVQLAFNKAESLFPVTNEALNDPYYTNNDALKVYASQLQKVEPRPGTPAWPDLEQTVVDMLRSVVLDKGGDYTVIINKYQKTAQDATDNLFH